jgi:hypothetical protein
MSKPGRVCASLRIRDMLGRRTAFASRMMAAGCASLDADAMHCCSDAAKNQQPKASSHHYPLPVEITQNED